MMKRVLILLLVFLPDSAVARGVFEWSLGFGYSRNQFSDGSYTLSRRMGSSLAYHFSGRSGVELSYNLGVTRTDIKNSDDLKYTDQVYSISWIQHLLPPKVFFQPFFKVGVGQLDRKIEGTYASGASPPSRVLSVTVVLTGGIKIRVSKRIAVRAELTSYLTGGSIATYKDNISFNAGGSIFF